MARLVQSHKDVAFFFGGDACDEFVEAEGVISKEEVALIDVFE